MNQKNIEDMTFNELCTDLTEQFMNGIIRGEPIGRNIRAIAEGAVYWRSEKTKAEEKAKTPVPKVLVKTDPSYPEQLAAVEAFNETLKPKAQNR